MTADDLLFGSPTREDRGTEDKSDLDILNEILGGGGALGGQGTTESENSFSKTWKDMFGDEPLESTQQAQEPSQSWSQEGTNFMMPSDLLNSMAKFDPFGEVPAGPSPQLGTTSQRPTVTGLLKQPQQLPKNLWQGNQAPSESKQVPSVPGKGKEKGKGKKGSDMSAWFSLFSDLDPLANPDAIDKQNKKSEEDRQC